MPEEELDERIVFSLAAPLVRVAVWLGTPLKSVERIVRMAYFRASKATGLTNQEIAEVMGVSVPTVARIARTTRENFLQPEVEHQLPQRIEFMLWAEPMTAAKIHQILHMYEMEEIESALESMLGDQRVELREEDHRYQLARPQGRLVKSNWVARVGALNSLLDNLTRTVVQRFRPGDSNDDGFARTLNLSVAPEDVGRLKELYELVIWPSLVALEQRAEGRDDPVEVKLSLFWATGDPLGKGDDE